MRRGKRDFPVLRGASPPPAALAARSGAGAPSGAAAAAGGGRRGASPTAAALGASWAALEALRGAAQQALAEGLSPTSRVGTPKRPRAEEPGPAGRWGGAARVKADAGAPAGGAAAPGRSRAALAADLAGSVAGSAGEAARPGASRGQAAGAVQRGRGQGSAGARGSAGGRPRGAGGGWPGLANGAGAPLGSPTPSVSQRWGAYGERADDASHGERQRIPQPEALAGRRAHRHASPVHGTAAPLLPPPLQAQLRTSGQLRQPAHVQPTGPDAAGSAAHEYWARRGLPPPPGLAAGTPSRAGPAVGPGAAGPAAGSSGAGPGLDFGRRVAHAAALGLAGPATPGAGAASPPPPPPPPPPLPPPRPQSGASEPGHTATGAPALCAATLDTDAVRGREERSDGGGAAGVGPVGLPGPVRGSGGSGMPVGAWSKADAAVAVKAALKPLLAAGELTRERFKVAARAATHALAAAPHAPADAGARASAVAAAVHAALRAAA